MCHISKGRVERCQHSSDTDFQNILKIVLNIRLAASTHLIARAPQYHSDRSRQQPTRHDFAVDMQRRSTVADLFDREHASTHHTQPPSSGYDAPRNETAQRKRKRVDTNEVSSSRADALFNGTAQEKRQRFDTNPTPALKGQSRIDEQSQTSDRKGCQQLGSNAHTGGRSYDQLVAPRSDARTDWENGRGQGKGCHDPPSSSRQQTTRGVTGEPKGQGLSQDDSQDHTRDDEIEVSTTGMNGLPPPCWEDKQMSLLPRLEQMGMRNFYLMQEKVLKLCWWRYGKEYEELKAVHTPERDETWTPDFEEEEIVERDQPLWEEIWERSMLGWKAPMRDFLDEDEPRPSEAREEADIWTGEPDGMLSSRVLRKLHRILTLEETLREEEGERWDENRRPATFWARDEVTQSFSDDLTSASADYPPLASLE